MNNTIMNRIVFPLALHSLVMLQFCLGAEFRNLGFDEADTTALPRPTGGPRGPADVAQVLPGWNLYLGGERTGMIDVNPALLEGGNHAVLGDGRTGSTPSFPVVEGQFALLLERSDPFAPVWSLEQTGTIPPGTEFLTYRCRSFGMEVQMNDEVILPLNRPLPSPPGFTNLVYDVSKFAGQEVKLAFVGPFGSYGWPDRMASSYIDSIMFLTEEPRITAVVQKALGTKTNEVTIKFNPIAGRKVFVQFRDDLNPGGSWQDLLVAPDNSGTVVDLSPAPRRIYRLEFFVPGP